MIDKSSSPIPGITQLAAMARVILGGRPVEATITLIGTGDPHGKDWLAWSNRAGINLLVHLSDKKTASSQAVELQIKGLNGQTITICGTSIGGMQIIELRKRVDDMDRRLYYLTQEVRDFTASAQSLQTLVRTVTAALYGGHIQ